MLHQTYPPDWHQIFLVAAGFLTAILLVWSQHWVRSLYEEQPYDDRPEADRRFTTHTMRLWLIVGVFFALCAFGLTGLDWVLTPQSMLLEQLATGFLMGAFDITLIGIAIEIFNAGRTLKRKGETKRIDYTDEDKKCLFIAVCAALALVWACCLFLAFNPLPLGPWLFRAFLSILYPALILVGAYTCISHK